MEIEPMATEKVPLFWNCKTPIGWKRYQAAFGAKGRIRPKYAHVGDTQILYPEGHYEMRLTEKGKRIWRNIGDDPARAVTEQERASRRVSAVKAVGYSDLTLAPTSDRLDLYKKLDTFVERQHTRGKKRHAVIAKRDVKQFLDVTDCRFADQLTEARILDWYDFLRGKRNSDYTIHNKHIMVFGYLKWCGVVTKSIAPHLNPLRSIGAPCLEFGTRNCIRSGLWYTGDRRENRKTRDANSVRLFCGGFDDDAGPSAKGRKIVALAA
jgi:hypothetical protein